MEPGYYWVTWAGQRGKPLIAHVCIARTEAHSKVTYLVVKLPGSREAWQLTTFTFLQRIPNYEDPSNSSDPGHSSG